MTLLPGQLMMSYGLFKRLIPTLSARTLNSSENMWVFPLHEMSSLCSLKVNPRLYFSTGPGYKLQPNNVCIWLYMFPDLGKTSPWQDNCLLNFYSTGQCHRLQWTMDPQTQLLAVSYSWNAHATRENTHSAVYSMLLLSVAPMASWSGLTGLRKLWLLNRWIMSHVPLTYNSIQSWFFPYNNQRRNLLWDLTE